MDFEEYTRQIVDMMIDIGVDPQEILAHTEEISGCIIYGYINGFPAEEIVNRCTREDKGE